MTNAWDSPVPWLEWTCQLLGMGAVIAAAERIWCYGAFREDGLLEWRLCRHNPWFASLPAWARALGEPFMRWPNCMIVAALHGFAGGALACWPAVGAPHRCALFVLVVTGLLWQYRAAALATYGADSVRITVGQVLLLRSLAPESHLAGVLCLILLSTFAVSAYFGAGLLKRRHAEWRAGTALALLLQHESHGNPRLLRLAERHPLLARLAAWSVLWFQITFPLALTGSGPAAVYLAFGLAMHIGIALVMGINGFVWSMGALYPAVYYLASNYAK